MKVIVTGGAGFIGSNFIFYMSKQHPDYDMTCMDCLTYAGKLQTLSSVMENPKFHFIRADIRDERAVDKVFKETEPDIIVNFAAESHVDRAITNPQLFLDTNVVGTSVLLQACVKYGIRRFHQISTDEVYGELPLDGSAPAFTEETLLHPGNPYSASKAGADLLALSYHKTYGVPVTISRCSNNYGPWQDQEKLIPLMVTYALQDKPLPVYGTGKNVRDWIHVEDHCRAVDDVIHRGRVGEIYNVGSNHEMPNIEIVKYICRALGKPESLIQFVEDRKGHDKRYAINSQKLQHELGWRPRIELETGLLQTVRWYVTHQKWWRL